MSRTLRIFIIVVILLLFVAVGWLIFSASTRQINPSTNSPSTSVSADQPKDLTSEASVSITIHDFAYDPANIKIKKGTKVTWTNQDSMGHNVVADDANNSGGLPTENDLMNKGQTYEFTFNEVGTFTYHCTPHSFMHGSVEVVE